MFMGQWLRRAVKPLCISAHTLRARARAFASAGHSCLSGQVSATYSAMASVSHTTRSPSTSTGTLAVGLTAPMVRLNSDCASKLSKRTRTSSNAMPACLSSTQGRMDQEE